MESGNAPGSGAPQRPGGSTHGHASRATSAAARARTAALIAFASALVLLVVTPASALAARAWSASDDDGEFSRTYTATETTSGDLTIEVGVSKFCFIASTGQSATYTNVNVASNGSFSASGAPGGPGGTINVSGQIVGNTMHATVTYNTHVTFPPGCEHDYSGAWSLTAVATGAGNQDVCDRHYLRSEYSGGFPSGFFVQRDPEAYYSLSVRWCTDDGKVKDVRPTATRVETGTSSIVGRLEDAARAYFFGYRLKWVTGKHPAPTIETLPNGATRVTASTGKWAVCVDSTGLSPALAMKGFLKFRKWKKARKLARWVKGLRGWKRLVRIGGKAEKRLSKELSTPGPRWFKRANKRVKNRYYKRLRLKARARAYRSKKAKRIQREATQRLKQKYLAQNLRRRPPLRGLTTEQRRRAEKAGRDARRRYADEQGELAVKKHSYDKASVKTIEGLHAAGLFDGIVACHRMWSPKITVLLPPTPRPTAPFHAGEHSRLWEIIETADVYAG